MLCVVRYEQRSLHVQIADDLRDRIRVGRYPDRSALPSESELAGEYEVSRVTINRAVTVLREEGLVEVRRGRDTRVTTGTVTIRVPLPQAVAEAAERAAEGEGLTVAQWAAQRLTEAVG